MGKLPKAVPVLKQDKQDDTMNYMLISLAQILGGNEKKNIWD